MQIAKPAQQLITTDELWEMPEVPGKRFELVDGALVEMPGASLLHNLIAALVYRLLAAFVRDQDLGLVFTDGAGFVLRPPYLMRIPDVSVVSWAQVPEEGLAEGYGQFAPELAVEVVSPTDRAGEVREKVHNYLEAGTKTVWVLWPDLRAVSVHAAGGITRELGPDDELDGGDVLPGFRVPVRDLFNVRSHR
jgi:Uma2 family endonuclease